MANHLQAKSGTVRIYLAPDAENKDLFYRRLREGNKDNWLDELAHSEREIASIEDKLAILYERRGQIVGVYACPRFRPRATPNASRTGSITK